MLVRKERPQLHAADLRFRRKLVLVALCLGLFVIVFITLENKFKAVSWFTGEEAYKLLLQFFLITAGGGAFLAIVGNAQSVAARRQERAASIQSLDRELDSAYRALKKIKRRLRAHSRFVDGEDRRPDAAGAEHRIGRAVFERAMDDLLDAQLRLETVCDHIGQRDDILRRDRLARMKGPLRYASRYFHDVHEDFERGRVRLQGDCYALGKAFNLNDYLRSSADTEEQLPKPVLYHLARLKSDSLELSERAEALDSLIAESPEEPDGREGRAEEPARRHRKREPRKVRYAEAAGACFDLLSAELAEVRAHLLS